MQVPPLQGRNSRGPLPFLRPLPRLPQRKINHFLQKFKRFKFASLRDYYQLGEEAKGGGGAPLMDFKMVLLGCDRQGGIHQCLHNFANHMYTICNPILNKIRSLSIGLPLSLPPSLPPSLPSSLSTPPSLPSCRIVYSCANRAEYHGRIRPKSLIIPPPSYRIKSHVPIKRGLLSPPPPAPPPTHPE